MTKLAIIAGQGHIPVDIGHAAIAHGYDVVIMPLEHQADADFSDFETVPIGLANIGRTRKLMLEHKCDAMIMVGKVRRPPIGDLRPDMDGVKLLGKMLLRGDDQSLRLVAEYFAETGIKVMAASDIMPDRQIREGIIAGARLGKQHQVDLDLGCAVLDSIGSHDIGQGVVVQDGRIIAIEAAEGTDAMLTRSSDLLDKTASSAVFLKTPKSGQDMRLDIPFIGLETVKAAGDANIGVIAIESGGVMLADPLDDVIAACKAHNITLVGLKPRNVR